MTTMISLHPAYRNDIKLSAGKPKPMYDNSNCMSLLFESTPYGENVFESRQEVTIFGLDRTTADALHLLSKLSVADRAKALVHLKIIADMAEVKA